MATNNIYQMVTDRIVEQLGKGLIPWHRPWDGGDDGAFVAINYVTRKPYSLINQWLLGKEGEWLTFKQCTDAGGRIKKGAKARPVVFYSMVKRTMKTCEDGTMEEVVIESMFPILRYYNVFHISDCEGIETKVDDDVKRDIEPIDEAERIINDYLTAEPKLKFENNKPSNRAFYSSAFDCVVVPMMNQYALKEQYYSTAFHELTHSTLPVYRCNRAKENKDAFFGNENYSREELVAEIGAAMLCSCAGLDTDKAFNNSVAYIQSWLKALKNDNRMIVWAAIRAEKAVRYILGERNNNQEQ